MQDYLQKLKTNIWKLYVISFLNWFMLVIPILVLFYQEHGLSMQEVMIIQAVFGLVIVLLEIPSGYFADRMGRKRSIVIGAVFSVIGMSIYSISGSFWCFLLAEIMFGIGASFISGADTALLYDSLTELNRVDEFSKIQGKAGAFSNYAEGLGSIIGGALALISFRIPFYIETVVLFLAIPLALSLVEPKRHVFESKESSVKEIFNIVKYAFCENKKVKWLILYSAFIGAATLNTAWFVQPYWKMIAVPLFLFGPLWALLQFIVGFSSTIAYKVQKSIKMEWLFLSFVFLVGFTYFVLGSVKIAWIGFLLPIFYIVRGIKNPLVKTYINELIPSHIRATVISIQNLVGRLVFVFVGPFLGFISDKYDMYSAFSGAALIFSIPALLSYFYLLKADGG